jgi:hypothetical protein
MEDLRRHLLGEGGDRQSRRNPRQEPIWLRFMRRKTSGSVAQRRPEFRLGPRTEILPEAGFE